MEIEDGEFSFLPRPLRSVFYAPSSILYPPSPMRFSAALLLALLLLVVAVPTAEAQPATAPRVEVAEQAFQRGLQLYESGQHRRAYDVFIQAATEHGYHQRTTAAYLMAGKALLAAGELDGAASAMTTLISTYPSSRYVTEARRVRREALAARERIPAAPPAIAVGVTLPLGENNVVFSQALFNGLRLAVDEHNAGDPDRPIRMVFRASGEGVATAEAVAALSQEDAAVIVGPLYSEEAASAAAAAERLGITLVAPLATDSRVSGGRRYVFQANPTFEARGRAMARFASERNLGRIGVVAVRGTFAETMGEAFRTEAERRGVPIPFFDRLPSEEGWFQLPERIGVERLQAVDALYLPAGGSDQASSVLRGLDRAFAEAPSLPRVLANGEWMGVISDPTQAARYGTIFTSDFYLSPETTERRRFEDRYRALAGAEPDRLAYMGYDLGQLLLSALADRRGEEPVAEALRRARPHAGLGHRFDFAGGQVNTALFFLGARDGSVALVE